MERGKLCWGVHKAIETEVLSCLARSDNQAWCWLPLIWVCSDSLQPHGAGAIWGACGGGVWLLWWGGAACECCLGFQHLLGFTLQPSGLCPQEPFAFPAHDAGAVFTGRRAPGRTYPAATSTGHVGMICMWFLTCWEGWDHAEYFCFWFFFFFFWTLFNKVLPGKCCDA